MILIIIGHRSVLYLINSFRKFHHIALKHNIFRIVAATRYRLSIIIALIIALIDLLRLSIVLIIGDCLLFDGIGISDSTDDLFILVLELLDAMLELLEFFGEVHLLLALA